MKVINGEGLLLGRVCSYAAKAALLGEEVRLVNCEKLVISGEKRGILIREKERREKKGYPLKSTQLSRLPDRFVKRVIRGMLPYKKERGALAWKRVRCYIGRPEEFSGKEITIEEASIKKLPTKKYIEVREICDWLRGRSRK